MENLIIVKRRGDLDRLLFWLKLENISSIAYFLSPFIFILIWFLTISAVLFTPYMLTVLIKEEKYGWILIFLLFIILPSFLILLSSLTDFYKEGLLFIPLGLFYLYCFILRFVVSDWVSEKSAMIARLREKKIESESNGIIV